MTFLDLFGLAFGLPLIAWVIWTLHMHWKEAGRTYTDMREHCEREEANRLAGVQSTHELYWRVNRKVPAFYRSKG